MSRTRENPLEESEVLEKRVLALEKLFAEFAKWTKFNIRENIQEDQGAAETVANVAEIVGAESSPGNVQNDGIQERDLEPDYLALLGDDDYQEKDNGIDNPEMTPSGEAQQNTGTEEVASNCSNDNHIKIPQGTFSDGIPPPNPDSSMELEDRNEEMEPVPKRKRGRPRKYVKDLKKPSELSKSKRPVGRPKSRKNVDGGVTPIIGESTNVENVQNLNGSEEMDIVSNVEVMEANDDHNGMDDPQGTPSDKSRPVTPIPEVFSPIELGEECMNTPTAAGSIEGGLDQGSKDVGTRPPRVTTKDENVQCQLEDEIDSSNGNLNSSISIDSSDSESAESVQKKKRNKGSRKKKSATATKSSSSAKSKPEWKCPHCPKILSSQSNLTQHIRSHTGERPFRCPHCPQTTTQAGALRSHIRRMHRKENRNFFTCRICQNKFTSQKNLMKHMHAHLKCYFCSHKFRKFHVMRSHLATHTGEKPFSCPRCQHSTTQEGKLRDHIRRKHPNAK